MYRLVPLISGQPRTFVAQTITNGTRCCRRRLATDLTNHVADDSDRLLIRQLSDQNKIARILLNSPRRRNAMSLAMIETLQTELAQLNQLQNLRAIIVASNSKIFSSGHDLSEMKSNQGIAKHRELFKQFTELMQQIQELDVPVIAEVNGAAVAAGCQLVASCDIVIAGRSSVFSTPGIKVGLFCSTPGVALARAVPRKAALDMLMTGDNIDAQDALRMGLVSRVVDDSAVEQEALQVAQKIASMSRPVIAMGKKFFYRQVQLPVSDAYRMGECVMVENLHLDDAQEGISAFSEKRQPNWNHSTEKTT